MTDKDTPLILPGTDGECGIPFRVDKDGKAIPDSIQLSVSKNSTLSDDKRFQEQLAIEISNRFAYRAQEAWQAYIKKNQHRYKDYTLAHLSKSGYEWRLNWMVNKMADNIAQITATLTDLLGITNDLRALSKTRNLSERAT